MQQSAKKISSRILSELDPGQPYYTISDLRSTSLPSSVCKHVQVVLIEKIRQDVATPKTAWANTESDSVRKAWKTFQDEIEKKAYIRGARANEFLSEAITSFLKLYIEPRKQMADKFFGSNQTLSYYELEKEVESLAIHKHYGVAILKYMRKRGLDSLSREKCSLLIKKLDENLANSYSSEEWAQALSLLFEMFRDEVDPEILNRFFADKELSRFAAIFGNMDADISRKTFEEILENPDAFASSHQPKEKTQADLFVDEESDEESALVNQFMETSEKDSVHAKEESHEDDSFNALFKTEEEQDVFFNHFEESAPEPADFNVTAPGPVVATPEDPAIDEEEETEEVVPEEQEHEEPVSEEETQPVVNKNIEVDEAEENDSDEEGLGMTSEGKGEAPMWQQYLDPNEAQQEETEEDSFAHEDFVEDIFGDEEEKEDESPVYSEETISLREHLKAKESEYVALIFKGSKQNYVSAMEEIQDLENWEAASDYIQDKVFTPNTVDMFSDVAVDFTDQLQSYFDEYKS